MKEYRARAAGMSKEQRSAAMLDIAQEMQQLGVSLRAVADLKASSLFPVLQRCISALDRFRSPLCCCYLILSLADVFSGGSSSSCGSCKSPLIVAAHQNAFTVTDWARGLRLEAGGPDSLLVAETIILQGQIQKVAPV